MVPKKKVKCLVCGQILCYDSSNTGPLVEHLNQNHCGTDVFRFLVNLDESPSENKNIYQQTANNQKVYKTTVEYWRPGVNKIKCPFCNEESIPLIKKQRKNISNNPLTALLAAGCWPLCSMPFGFCTNDIIHLYCCNCHEYLGCYDYSSNTVACARKPDACGNFPG